MNFLCENNLYLRILKAKDQLQLGSQAMIHHLAIFNTLNWSISKTRLKKVSRWRFHIPHHTSRLLCVGVSTVCVRTPIKETYWCTNSWACWQKLMISLKKTVFQYVIIFLFQNYIKIRVSLNESLLTTVLQLCHTLCISLSSNLEASANYTWKC